MMEEIPGKIEAEIHNLQAQISSAAERLKELDGAKTGFNSNLAVLELQVCSSLDDPAGQMFTH